MLTPLDPLKISKVAKDFWAFITGELRWIALPRCVAVLVLIRRHRRCRSAAVAMLILAVYAAIVIKFWHTTVIKSSSPVIAHHLKLVLVLACDGPHASPVISFRVPHDSALDVPADHDRRRPARPVVGVHSLHVRLVGQERRGATPLSSLAIPLSSFVLAWAELPAVPVAGRHVVQRHFRRPARQGAKEAPYPCGSSLCSPLPLFTGAIR